MLFDSLTKLPEGISLLFCKTALPYFSSVPNFLQPYSSADDLASYFIEKNSCDQIKVSHFPSPDLLTYLLVCQNTSS